MTPSLAEATGAARRIRTPGSYAGGAHRSHDFAEDADLLAAFVLAGDTERPEPFVLWLTWRCLNCGWETTMRAPGFAGDGHDHFPDGRTPCGPLRAQKAWPSEIAAEESRAALAEGGA